MIATTFQDKPVFLLPYRLDLATKIAAKFTLTTEEQRSNDGVEARRPYNATSIAQLECGYTLRGQEWSDYRIGRQRLKNKSILLPFWAALTAASAAKPPLLTGIWLTYEPDLSAWEIHTTDAPTGFVPSALAARVPLLLGFLEKSSAKAIDKDAGTASLSFTESGSYLYALRPSAADGVAGLALPTGVVPKVFPLLPNWANAPEAGDALVEIHREQIGFSRTPAETYYDQPSARPLQFSFSQGNLDQAAQLLAFFLARAGTVESFWLPGAFDECLLTAATSLANGIVQVDRAAALGDNRHLTLLDAYGAPEVVKVATIAGNTLTLAGPPTKVYRPGECRLVSAILSRFKKPELALSFQGSGISEGSIAFIETPSELTAQAGETIGVTMGAQQRIGFGYKFTQYFPDTTLIARFTSYERPIVAAGDLFQAEGKDCFKHDETVDDLQIDRATCKLTSRKFEGNPLNLYMPFRVESPLWCQIYEFEVDADANATSIKTLWLGKVSKPVLTGPKYETTIKHFLQSLGTSIPTAMVGGPCWKKFCGPTCKLLEEDWTFSGVLADYDAAGAAMTFTTLARKLGGALPTIDAGFFVPGRIYTGPGLPYSSRDVYASTVWDGSSLTVLLNRALDEAPALGSLFYLVAGCDHSPERCAVFGNYDANYGGMRWVPNGNPTLVPVKKTEGGGKK